MLSVFVAPCSKKIIRKFDMAPFHVTNNKNYNFNMFQRKDQFQYSQVEVIIKIYTT